MRMIEKRIGQEAERIFQLVQRRDEYAQSKLSPRDLVYVKADDRDPRLDHVIYRLWYTDIAEYIGNGQWVKLIADGAPWSGSRTTQSRLRALGLVAPPNPHYLRRRSHYRETFDGSYDLFLACWRKLKEYSNGTEIDDRNAAEWLDSIADELVNDSSSAFYIHG